MSTQANVHSLEAIDSLRTALLAFMAQVSDALAELDAEMRRMLEWLEHDRPRHWKSQLRLSIDQVHEAQQALHRCLMFPIADERPSCYEERAALKKAQARHEYCEHKIERVRHWQRSVQHELFEYQGRISQIVRLIEIEVPHAIGLLHKIVRRLEDYQTVGAADPQAAYNDLALVKDLWPEGGAATPAEPAPAGEAASAAESTASPPAELKSAAPTESTAHDADNQEERAPR
jgi:hypothetical protein